MKTTLLFISILLYASNTFATHYRGGEIIYRMVGNFQCEATVILYSKYDGISMPADRDSIRLSWGDGTTSIICRSNGPVNASGCREGEVISSSPNIKKSEYVATHTYAGIPARGFYILSFFNMNRIGGINNIGNGQSINVPLYLEVKLFIANAPNLNSSPVFLNAPVDYANLTDTFTFNSVAYDADGDSMDFQLVTPLQDVGNIVSAYSFPQAYCQALGNPANGFQINAKTG